MLAQPRSLDSGSDPPGSRLSTLGQNMRYRFLPSPASVKAPAGRIVDRSRLTARAERVWGGPGAEGAPARPGACGGAAQLTFQEQASIVGHVYAMIRCVWWRCLSTKPG